MGDGKFHILLPLTHFSHAWDKTLKGTCSAFFPFFFFFNVFSFQRTGEATRVCHHPPGQQPVSPLQILDASSATCISTLSSKGVEASRAMCYNSYN